MNNEEMTEIQANRLLNVATALREAPIEIAALFDMGKFGYGFRAHVVKYLTGKTKKRYNCKTPACALGHYAIRHDMQRTFALNVMGKLTRMPPHNRHEIAFCDPRVKSHFGITAKESEYLFGTKGCGKAKTTEAAATYIEKFLIRKGWDFNHVSIRRAA